MDHCGQVGTWGLWVSRLPTCGRVACGSVPLPLFASLHLEASSPHPTLQERQRLKEILSISVFTCHTYTFREIRQPFSWKAVLVVHTHTALLRGQGPPSIPELTYPIGWEVQGHIYPEEGEPHVSWQSSALAVAYKAPPRTCLRVSKPLPSSTGCSSSWPSSPRPLHLLFLSACKTSCGSHLTLASLCLNVTLPELPT